MEKDCCDEGCDCCDCWDCCEALGICEEFMLPALAEVCDALVAATSGGAGTKVVAAAPEKDAR